MSDQTSTAITYPEPTGEHVRASVDVTERFYSCSLPAPTRESPHRIVVARIRAYRDVLTEDWTIEVADLTDKQVKRAFPGRLWPQRVHRNMVDTYGTKLAARIVHVLWLDDRREQLAREVESDWRSADLDAQGSDNGS